MWYSAMTFEIYMLYADEQYFGTDTIDKYSGIAYTIGTVGETMGLAFAAFLAALVHLKILNISVRTIIVTLFLGSTKDL